MRVNKAFIGKKVKCAYTLTFFPTFGAICYVMSFEGIITAICDYGFKAKTKIGESWQFWPVQVVEILE